MFFASIALKSETTMNTNTTNTTNSAFIQPISSHPNTMVAAPPVGSVGSMGMPTAMQAAMPSMMPSATTTSVSARVPGYYILDPYANPAHPRYIYYGPEPPGMQS
jgi:hypothetical protein